MKTTYVTLAVQDDDDAREWWEALGLPAPERWLSDDPFAPDTYIRPVLEVVERPRS